MINYPKIFKPDKQIKYSLHMSKWIMSSVFNQEEAENLGTVPINVWEPNSYSSFNYLQLILASDSYISSLLRHIGSLHEVYKILTN